MGDFVHKKPKKSLELFTEGKEQKKNSHKIINNFSLYVPTGFEEVFSDEIASLKR